MVRVSGEVSWRAASGTDWRPLGVGAELRSGDWVRTGLSGSFAELVYIGEAARLFVEADTLLQIGGAYQTLVRVGRDRGELPAFRAAFLQVGRLWVQVVAGLSRLWRFEVQTPTAVAGVRGTLFRLEVTPAGDTRLYVRQGVVELRTARLRVLVRERQGAATTRTGQAPQGFTEESEAGAERLGWEDGQEDEALERESEPQRLAWLRWLQGELEDELLEDDALRRAVLEQARAARDAGRSGLVEWLLRLEKLAEVSEDEAQAETAEPEAEKSSDDEGADTPDESEGGPGEEADGADHGPNGRNGYEAGRPGPEHDGKSDDGM